MTCSCDYGKTVPWDEFLPYILPNMGDVPDAIAAHAARLATIELAQVSYEIKATLVMDAFNGVPHYDLNADDGYTVLLLDYVDLCGCEYTANRQTHGFGRCRQYTFDRPEERIILNPAPTCTTPRGLEIRAVVAPSQDSCFVPVSVYERHAETIANGAMMRLYKMRAASWFDVGLAREYERLWRDSLRWIRVHSLKGGSTAGLALKAKRVV